MEPKISENEFYEIIESIRQQTLFQDRLFGLCREYRQNTKDEAELWLPSLSSATIRALSLLLDDDEEWIGYWIIELDFGQKYKPGLYKSQDGTEIPLGTVSDLWNMLLKNYHEKNSKENTQ